MGQAKDDERHSQGGAVAEQHGQDQVNRDRHAAQDQQQKDEDDDGDQDFRPALVRVLYGCQIAGAGRRADEGQLRLRQVGAQGVLDPVQGAQGLARERVDAQHHVQVGQVLLPVAAMADVILDRPLPRGRREELRTDGEEAQRFLGGRRRPQRRSDAVDVGDLQLILVCQQAVGQAGHRLEILFVAEVDPGTLQQDDERPGDSGWEMLLQSAGRCLAGHVRWQSADRVINLIVVMQDGHDHEGDQRCYGGGPDHSGPAQQSWSQFLPYVGKHVLGHEPAR